MTKDVRVGWIDYLNSLPVYMGLDRGDVPLPSGMRLEKGTPSELNARLLRGDLDVSPVSSLHYAKHQDALTLLPDLSINSAGFVHSVCLFYRNGIDTLQDGTVCVTDESATSDVLLRILLEERFGLQTRRVKGEPDLEELGRAYDGALLIGDSALKAALAYPNLGRVDLSEEWTRWTGTPMVFAVWCARRDFARDEPDALRAAHQTLLAGKAWGRAHRDVIIEHSRKRLFLSRAVMTRYFRDLDYDLDASKLAGLRRYLDLAHARGEIDRVPPLLPREVAP